MIDKVIKKEPMLRIFIAASARLQHNSMNSVRLSTGSFLQHKIKTEAVEGIK